MSIRKHTEHLFGFNDTFMAGIYCGTGQTLCSPPFNILAFSLFSLQMLFIAENYDAHNSIRPVFTIRLVNEMIFTFAYTNIHRMYHTIQQFLVLCRFDHNATCTPTFSSHTHTKRKTQFVIANIDWNECAKDQGTINQNIQINIYIVYEQWTVSKSISLTMRFMWMCYILPQINQILLNLYAKLFKMAIPLGVLHCCCLLKTICLSAINTNWINLNLWWQCKHQ